MTTATPYATKDAANAAETRVSIRNYSPVPPPLEEIQELIRLAAKAPSAWNIQPWRFIVISDQEVKIRLQAAAHGQAQVGSAPYVIALYSDVKSALGLIDLELHPELSDERRNAAKKSVLGAFDSMSEEAQSAWGRSQANIALGYLMLLAESFGLGTSPMLGFDPAQVKAILDLPAHAEIVALVSIGTPAEQGFSQHRLPLDKILTLR